MLEPDSPNLKPRFSLCWRPILREAIQWNPAAADNIRRQSEVDYIEDIEKFRAKLDCSQLTPASFAAFAEPIATQGCQLPVCPPGA